MGQLLKIDTCTSLTLRGKYARLCIQIPLNSPVKDLIQIGNHVQKIINERDGILCTYCGKLRHVLRNCSDHTSLNNKNQSPSSSKQPQMESKWQTVSFPRRKKPVPRCDTQVRNLEKKLVPLPGKSFIHNSNIFTLLTRQSTPSEIPNTSYTLQNFSRKENSKMAERSIINHADGVRVGGSLSHISPTTTFNKSKYTFCQSRLNSVIPTFLISQAGSPSLTRYRHLWQGTHGD